MRTVSRVWHRLENIATRRPRGNAGNLFTAALCMFLLFLLFRPWVAASGVDGVAQANAFGTLHVTNTRVSFWSGSPPSGALISGTRGILTGLAALATLFTSLANWRAPNRTASYAVPALATATTLLTTSTVLYLDSKGNDMRHMLAPGPATDLGTQAGLVIRWLAGNGDYPVPGLHKSSYTTASLTVWATLAPVVSLASAAVAINPLIRRTTGRWRISASRSPVKQKSLRVGLDDETWHQ
ncbi:hypothetical protein [Nocardia sp. NBC_00511]|uniref:hypothetical protein n=1 Tax=Nocardia sp. NBC_00511 TaxID=2903591 RepID=UPI0030DE1FFC